MPRNTQNRRACRRDEHSETFSTQWEPLASVSIVAKSYDHVQDWRNI